MKLFFPAVQSFFVAASDSARPLVAGLFKSRKTAEQRRQAKALKNTIALNRMARDLETSQPGLAAELRYFASR